ncbi:MAG: hypothetical protein LUQ66_07610 [Methanoregula sp.]|nr:hypothetical protein [Methanoregula sp.]
MDTDEQLKVKLKEIWAKSQDWDESPTSEEGIFIVKYPSSGINQAYIGIKFKRNPYSKKGIFVKSRKEIVMFQNLLNLKELAFFIDNMSNDKQLKKSIELLNDWDQITTPILGVSYTKMPDQNNPSGVPALAINPVDDLGKKIKRKNLFLRDCEDLEKYQLLFNNQKVDRLSRIIEEANDELSLEMRLAQSKVMGKYK